METKVFSFEIENYFKEIADIESVLILGDLNSDASPKLSILIPTYKRPDLLKRALDSAINQTVQTNYEIVVIDNDDNFGEKSETQKLLESYSCKNLRYYKNRKNLGMTHNWNRGIELARGEYVAFLHDDDFYEPNFVEKALKKAKGDKALFFSVRTVSEKTKDKPQSMSIRRVINKIVKYSVFYPIMLLNPKKNKVDLRTLFFCQPKVSCIGNVYRKDCMIDIGGFCPECFPGIDYEFNVRYVMRYGALHLKDIVANYWIGANDSLSSCVQFPSFNYNLRMSLLPHLKNNEKLRHLTEVMLATDIDGIVKSFHCDTSRFDQDMVERASRITDNQKKKFKRSRRFAPFVRFFK